MLNIQRKGGKNTRGGKLPACRRRTENFVREKKKSVSLKVTILIWYAICDKALRRYFS